MKLKALFLAALTFSGLATFTPAAAQTQTVRPILVQNYCHLPVRLWINHADGWRNWHSHGEFNLGAYGSNYLEDRGVRLTQRTDHDIYFYAETTNGAFVWDGGVETWVNGYNLPMRRQGFVLRNGAFVVELTC